MAVVEVGQSQEVAAAVRFAAERDLAVGVRATGHGSVPVGPEAILVDTAAMDGIQIDADTRTARIGAGVRSGDLVASAAALGLAPLNGASPSVGTVGYTLGGGIGPLGRAHGFAADHVRELELVTAEGTVQQVTADREPDLFWACRGGKGNFGIVTAMTLDLVEIEDFYGGGLWFAAAAGAEVLSAYADWTAGVPDRMTSSLALLRLPDLPALPPPVRGQFVVHVRIAFAGPAEEGEQLVEPLRTIAPRLIDSVAPMPYARVAEIHADPVEPGPYRDSSALLTELDAGAIKTLLERAGPQVQAPVDVVEIRHLGGAFARTPKEGNAVGYRRAGFTLFAVARAEGEQLAPAREFQRDLIEAMAPWRLGGPCLSYLGPEETDPAVVRSAWEPATYERLRRIKTDVDPANTFRINHNIPPLEASG
ncbi:oxidoreductase [Kineosporia sp. NBRC 101731]|nr:oxidoreductase [Kineosporia sp. NBRC 101731]